MTGLHAFFSEIYAPFMMKDHVRMFVIILFSSWLCSSLLVIGSIHVGLEQELSMPDDSYMVKSVSKYSCRKKPSESPLTAQFPHRSSTSKCTAITSKWVLRCTS